ncbi:hypothetical protein KAU34_08500, partial [candidate division WOR-3 bacterium]|nr:hypothetical protein [candidate division WOR-3 bacterium]
MKYENDFKFLIIVFTACLIIFVSLTKVLSYKKMSSVVETHELEKIEINQVEIYINNYGQYG